MPLVQAAGPSSEWICDRQSHPSHDHVDLAFKLPLPGNCAKCLVICSCDNVLESIFDWRQISGLCIISAEQFVPNSVRVFAVVSVQ